MSIACYATIRPAMRSGTGAIGLSPGWHRLTIDALKALASNAMTERDAAIAERDAAIGERDKLIDLNDRLRHLLRKAQGFEAKSERLAKLDPDQLNLALEDLEQAAAKAEAVEEKAKIASGPRKRRINRARCPPICRAFTKGKASAFHP
jgi:hypothetical protein